MSDTPPPERSGNQEMGGVDGTDAPLLSLSLFFLLIDGHISIVVNWFRSRSHPPYYSGEMREK